MVIEACICDQGAGLPHEHQYTYDKVYGVYAAVPIPYMIRMWVDWQAVSRGLFDLIIDMSGERGNVTPLSTRTSKRKPDVA